MKENKKMELSGYVAFIVNGHAVFGKGSTKSSFGVNNPYSLMDTDDDE